MTTSYSPVHDLPVHLLHVQLQGAQVADAEGLQRGAKGRQDDRVQRDVRSCWWLVVVMSCDLFWRFIADSCIQLWSFSATLFRKVKYEELPWKKVLNILQLNVHVQHHPWNFVCHKNKAHFLARAICSAVKTVTVSVQFQLPRRIPAVKHVLDKNCAPHRKLLWQPEATDFTSEASVPEAFPKHCSCAQLCLVLSFLRIQFAHHRCFGFAPSLL